MHIGIDARMYGISHRGIGRYIERLIENLARIDDNNRYTLFMTGGGAANFKSRGGKFKITRCSVPWYSFKEHWQMPWLIKTSGVELMHWPHINTPYFCPVPYVVTVHDLIVWHFPDSRATTLPNWQYRLKLRAHRAILKNSLKKARQIITVSQFTKRDVVRHLKIDAKKISVIYPGTDKMLLGTEKLANSESFTQYLNSNFGINKSYLFYVGSAYPHKNLERLIRAFVLLRQTYHRHWQLVLAGREDYFYKQLKKFINKAVADNSIRADIILTGQVSDKDLDGLYRGAKLFIFPSLYEGFGLPPLEAASRGLAVVAAKAGSIPEVMADAAYYFDPENIETMAQTIDVVGGSRHIQESLTAKGYERAEQFSWPKMAKNTSAIYDLSTTQFTSG